MRRLDKEQGQMKKSTKVVLTGAGGTAALLLAVGIANAAGSSTSHPVVQPKPQFSTSVPVGPAHDPLPTNTPTAPTTAPSTPSITTSQQQALDDAQGYLSDGSGFSQQGLIGQLEFDKFNASDATWAVDHSGADWNAQAVDDAKGYVSDGSGFSRDGLIGQLQFDKFTYNQAVYAANQVGLNG
jgi:Host cell surface-exposed lipoprotein